MNTRVSLLHSFSDEKQNTLFTPVFFVIIFVFILLGIATGYMIAQTRAANTSIGTMEGKQ
jgi:hypothetical protein